MAHIVLTLDIPWNRKALQANLRTAHVLFNNRDICRVGVAAWGTILCCDRMEELGFFNLAQGRDPNARL